MAKPLLADEQGDNGLKMDIGIFNTACAQFEVRLRPTESFVSNITNIQFTIKWPENTVNLINFSGDYQLAQQGPVYNDGGFNYAVFVAVTLEDELEEWEADTEYTVLTFTHDQSGTGKIDMFIAADQWAVENNGVHFVELLGLDYTGIIYHEVTDAFAGACNFAHIMVLLQGAYNASEGAMRTAINAAGNLPLEHPYGGTPWFHSGTENVEAFPDSIVDWVLIELRDADDPGFLMGRRAGLLSKHGVVMETDLTEGIGFENVPAGEYYLVVRHRNHLPVMSGMPVSLPNPGNTYNFIETVSTMPFKHNDPLPSVLEVAPASGKYGMIAGDVNADESLRYIGPQNDRDPKLAIIIQTTGSTDITQSILGYYNEDVNLDSRVLYIGDLNDRDIILANIIAVTGSPDITNIYISVVPPITGP